MIAGPEEDAPRVLARRHEVLGDLALRRRGDVLELVVNGVFAMDTAHTATEEALAALALAELTGRAGAQAAAWDVVVGGLGLGFTSRRLLEHPGVRSVLVVELHPALVTWARDGLVPSAAATLADPRVRVLVGDVLDVLPACPPASADAVLLDVDNGPDFLVHQGNAAVYESAFLDAAARLLRPGGVLAVWSADPAPGLGALLERICGGCREVVLPVQRDGRAWQYAVYLASTACEPAAGSSGSC